MYDLVREALEERPHVSYTVRCQFLEIYGEDIHDLLEPAGSTVTIREGQNGEVNVHGAKEMLVHGAEVKIRTGMVVRYHVVVIKIATTSLGLETVVEKKQQWAVNAG